MSGYCNKAVDAKMKKALQLGITNPPAALKLWAKVDKQVTDDATQAVLLNPRLIDFIVEARRELHLERAVLHDPGPGVGPVSAGARAHPRCLRSPWPATRSTPASSAAARGRSRGGACAATASRWSALGGFVLIVLACLGRRLLRQRRRAYRPVRLDDRRHDDHQRQALPVMVQAHGRPGPRRDADRADLGHPPLLPGCRQPGPRRRRPPALRRPQLAAHRHRLGAHLPASWRRSLALVAGFFGGVIDGILSRLFDLSGPFPSILLAISLSTVADHAAASHIGPITIPAGSLWMPILIIGLVYVPYVARPIRGEVLSLRAEGVRPGRDRPGREQPAPALRATSCPTSSRP